MNPSFSNHRMGWFRNRSAQYEESNKIHIPIMLFVICAVVLLAGPLSTIIHRVRDPKEKWQFPFVLKRTIVDATDSPWFEMVSFTEFFMMSYFAIIIINVDSVLSAIIAQLSTQLVILGYTFRYVLYWYNPVSFLNPNWCLYQSDIFFPIWNSFKLGSACTSPNIPLVSDVVVNGMVKNPQPEFGFQTFPRLLNVFGCHISLLR